ncbi:mitochondrial fission ELM1 family protein [Roseibacterium beibuensis]|uniref:Mitochondrial fission ELM1 family protein n=1 Tax=[Roseibacterium] beibuensis TaxID=1193142 RepID=A0ABP9KYB5_9RHOB|nr:mitochondrial fission ELM1 family protein [Roseibacterium beibuensis]MCS6621744.1 mitochondrial fission ELM1 family protein [Roseibacterium beibuensis]
MTDAPRVWILGDGRIGHAVPMMGVAERAGWPYEMRQVAPRKPFELLAPFGPIDPAEAPDRAGSPLAPPYPDICMASGRRTIPYLRHLKRVSPRTFTVLFRMPRTARTGADLIVVPEHDGFTAPNAITVPVLPHRFSPDRLAAARAAPSSALEGLPMPRVGVLIGGDSRHHSFTPDDIARLATGLSDLAESGAGLMVTLSRRTPKPLADAITALGKAETVYVWDGTGENPLTAILALSDALVVTADSTNMVGEAAATGAPIHLFHPSGGHPKITRAYEILERAAEIRPFPGPLDGTTYPPIDTTADVLAEIEARFAAHRARNSA